MNKLLQFWFGKVFPTIVLPGAEMQGPQIDMRYFRYELYPFILDDKLITNLKNQPTYMLNFLWPKLWTLQPDATVQNNIFAGLTR